MISLHEKAQKIRCIVLDVDGVLTDGRIGYGSQPGEIKFFDVKDGHGIVLARRAGLKVGILSGRKSAANQTRAAELKLDFLIEGALNKQEGFLELLKQQNLPAEACLYIGDDLVDIPPMHLAGIGVAVGDAAPELDAFAAFRTKASGGRGAVRETMEWLLKEQGRWDEVTARYFS